MIHRKRNAERCQPAFVRPAAIQGVRAAVEQEPVAVIGRGPPTRGPGIEHVDRHAGGRKQTSCREPGQTAPITATSHRRMIVMTALGVNKARTSELLLVNDPSGRGHNVSESKTYSRFAGFERRNPRRR